MIIVRSFKDWETELEKFKNAGNRIGLMAEDDLVYDRKLTKFYDNAYRYNQIKDRVDVVAYAFYPNFSDLCGSLYNNPHSFNVSEELFPRKSEEDIINDIDLFVDLLLIAPTELPYKELWDSLLEDTTDVSECSEGMNRNSSYTFGRVTAYCFLVLMQKVMPDILIGCPYAAPYQLYVKRYLDKIGVPFEYPGELVEADMYSAKKELHR